ncbi:MAG: formyltetrahydrofolate deformylase, partial [Actinobacteria bacterium]|nr:formyltetrahydrofolate deformylase [Actinomycetota bacterium]
MDLIATLQCADQRGIVHAMTSSVLACQGNIVENQQFTDPVTNSFVMRTRFETSASLDSAHKALSEGLAKFNPELTIRDNASPKRALVMVTKESHCLRDLLYLLELGELPIQIPLVVGNHQELQSLVESHNIKFKYLPVSRESKESSEAQLLSLISSEKIDFLVLARYMQILSSDFCGKLSNRIINIHHSFLPGFKGAKPYHQAHAKGV